MTGSMVLAIALGFLLGIAIGVGMLWDDRKKIALRIRELLGVEAELPSARPYDVTGADRAASPIPIAASVFAVAAGLATVGVGLAFDSLILVVLGGLATIPILLGLVMSMSRQRRGPTAGRQ